MDVLDIARWQFGIITVYHFLFVPLTIGLTAVIAGFETAWVRTGKEDYLRLTKFFGRLFLINFAIGVVTGIVQEFQFGMNWSDYSRFVGDIFGAPLAIEAPAGLLPRDRRSWACGSSAGTSSPAACTRRPCGWCTSARWRRRGSSWPPTRGCSTRWATATTPTPDGAELTDFWAVMFNKVQLVTFPHVIMSGLHHGRRFFVLGVAAYLYMKRSHETTARSTTGRSRVGAVVTLLAGLGVAITGDLQGKVMTEVQPMKMAAAEGLYETS